MRKEGIPTDAFLFSDNSTSSNKARKLLIASHISFKEYNSPNNQTNGYHPPTIISRQGEFNGLNEITDFIEIITNRP